MKQYLKDRNVRAFIGRHPALLGFIACLVIVMGTVAYVAVTSAQTRHALCALRGDLQQRIDSSTAFLQEHPEGIPGVSPKLIRDGIANQRRTVHALSSLSCS